MYSFIFFEYFNFVCKKEDLTGRNVTINKYIVK